MLFTYNGRDLVLRYHRRLGPALNALPPLSKKAHIGLLDLESLTQTADKAQNGTRRWPN
jgi:hypothetical protein